MKYSILKNVCLFFCLIFFTSCSSSFYEINQKKNLSFKLRGETLSIVLNNSKTRYRATMCTNRAYTLSENNEYYGKLFLEYISINSNCTGSGLEKSFFTSLFKKNRSVQTMKTLENFELSNYNFSTYLINDEYYMNIVFIYAHNKTTLIIDYEGKLTQDLLKKLGSSYKNPYLNKKRFDLNYEDSLVAKNIFNRYFYKEYRRYR